MSQFSSEPVYLEAFDNPSSIIVFCRALNRSKKIKHLVLSSNNLRMANNKDVEGALENVVTLNLANCVSSRGPENGSTEVIRASDQVILSLAYLCIQCWL